MNSNKDNNVAAAVYKNDDLIIEKISIQIWSNEIKIDKSVIDNKIFFLINNDEIINEHDSLNSTVIKNSFVIEDSKSLVENYLPASFTPITNKKRRRMECVDPNNSNEFIQSSPKTACETNKRFNKLSWN